MDKLKSLMSFMRSAQSSSFSEAARQLGMAPSAVSRAVLRLEDDLGVRLLQRTTRSLTLTEAGNRFYQRCQHIRLLAKVLVRVGQVGKREEQL